MSLPKRHQSESLNSGSSPHEWSQFERDQSLTALPSVEIVSVEGLEPEFSERIFELVSQGLAREKIMKTPQECQKLYDDFVEKGSMSKAMEQKESLTRLLDSYFTVFGKDARNHQGSEEPGPAEEKNATREASSIKVEPLLRDGNLSFQDRDKSEPAKSYRTFHCWSAQEDQCLYEEYKANFEDNKYDGRLAEHRWESIARNLEARGFQRRTRDACASHWAIKKEYAEEEAQYDLDTVLTEAQRDELEVAYKINEHPDNEAEAALAERVELLPYEVKVYVQLRYFFCKYHVDIVLLRHGSKERMAEGTRSSQRGIQEKGNVGRAHIMTIFTQLPQSPVIASRANHMAT
ncbi:hypothetical protein OCU04_001128 [Sclerotinia nivalis]|uniref:Myb-like domain-containing protein n=1 Tax=Sclerotinia nivalis TaxID=352851 RepID=A0A9X0AXJ1_9HELO|nr:hypothetical protein OCU04_001128 [Sclerotinia nivalis]